MTGTLDIETSQNYFCTFINLIRLNNLMKCRKRIFKFDLINQYLMKKIFLFSCCSVLAFPTCFGQWQQTSGPPGGIVKAIVKNSQYLFAAVDGEGVYRTPLDTIAWQEVNSGLTNITVKTFG